MKIVRHGIAKSLENDKELRIDNQYYLKNRRVGADYNKLLDFILYFKNLIETMTSDDIQRIREEVSRRV